MCHVHKPPCRTITQISMKHRLFLEEQKYFYFSCKHPSTLSDILILTQKYKKGHYLSAVPFRYRDLNIRDTDSFTYLPALLLLYDFPESVWKKLKYILQ